MSFDGSAHADSARSYCCGLTSKVLKCRAEQSQIHSEKAVLFEAPLHWQLTERRSDSQFSTVVELLGEWWYPVKG